MVFVTAAKLGYDDNAISTLGHEVSESLKEISAHKDAAEVLIEYCHSNEEGIVSLIKGSEWFEALRRVSGLMLIT